MSPIGIATRDGGGEAGNTSKTRPQFDPVETHSKDFRENRLTAEDGYWLGLVDEVVGARLPSLRLVVENPDV